MPMAIKLRRMMTYLEDLPSINSDDSLITLPSEITWQTTNISPLYFQSAYGHENWQDGILPQYTPAHKVT